MGKKHYADRNLKFETLALHVGQEKPDAVTDARAVPIYQTSSYVFHNSDHAEARFALKDAGNIYGRLTNPTEDVFEQRIAALEGGVAALAVGSGAAAVTYAFQAAAHAGDHIVSAKNIYGGTYNYLAHTFPDYGVTTTFVDPYDYDEIENAIKPNTKALYAETLGNPNGEVLDVENVIVYIVSRDGSYLRQKVRLGAQTAQKPRSLRVDRHPFLEELMREKKIYVNRTLAEGVPDLAAPVVHGGRTIAVIELYGMDFDQWSFAQQNLLAVTARLIAASLGRAYEWEREAAERKYLPGTRILRAAEFQKVLDSIGHREKLAADYPASLVPILGGPRDAATLDAVLSRVIRAEDFVGEHAGGLYLLLPDVTGATLAPALGDIIILYHEARTALDIARGQHLHTAPYVYEHGGLAELIVGSSMTEHFRSFANGLLAPLAAQDARSHGRLMETLAAFVAANGNVLHAARELYIHRNTLKYRLRQIEKALGGSLDDPDLRLKLQLALYVRRLLG